MPYPRAAPPAARHALAINYNCGQSKAWPDLSPAERDELARLAKGAPAGPLRKRK
ncbi:hypothetical protein [Novosphingobium sp. 9]|uniref:hypothetical protein n=1 Tax=Novosphingobium sp. 9 TaxID=2025349 RepID=UPI0021B677F4|nr:hypothetical protein [Novosphingobium sp. 9]